MRHRNLYNHVTFRDRLIIQAVTIARCYPAYPLDEIIEVVILASGPADRLYFDSLTEVGYKRFKREVYRKAYLG